MQNIFRMDLIKIIEVKFEFKHKNNRFKSFIFQLFYKFKNNKILSFFGNSFSLFIELYLFKSNACNKLFAYGFKRNVNK